MVPSLAADLYLDAFARERDALFDAAAGQLTVTVPSCPGWSMAALVAHVGVAYAYVTRTVRAQGVPAAEDLGLPVDVESWLAAGGETALVPAALLDWARGAGTDLERLLAQTDPSQRAWSWWEPDQTAGFWLRRMTHETAIHRWDAQAAVGRPEPIEAEMARDAVDEMMDVYLPRWCRPKSTMIGNGESYRFERSDGEATWTVRFDGDGMEVDHLRLNADVILRGSSSDLILFLWQRILSDRLEVEGDLAVLGTYFELVPPD
jgi:uncharacterized protein (TIGR03083 family)